MASLIKLGNTDTTKLKEMQSSIDTLTSTNSALNSEISSGKNSISTAITNKGVSTSASSSFDVMATNIGNISTGNVMVIVSYYNNYTPITTYNLTFSPTALFLVPSSSGNFGSCGAYLPGDDINYAIYNDNVVYKNPFEISGNTVKVKTQIWCGSITSILIAVS